MDKGKDGERNAAEPSVRSTFAAMAFGSILASVLVYLLQAQLGIPEDSARLVATVLLLMGAAELVLVYLWPRIFTRQK